MRYRASSPPDADIGQALGGEISRLVEVAQVDDHRAAQRRLDAIEIERAELVWRAATPTATA
jgi:hypothetical protein